MQLHKVNAQRVTPKLRLCIDPMTHPTGRENFTPIIFRGRSPGQDETSPGLFARAPEMLIRNNRHGRTIIVERAFSGPS